MTNEKEQAPLNPEEWEIIEWFRRMDETQRASLLKMARTRDTPANKARRGFYKALGKT